MVEKCDYKMVEEYDYREKKVVAVISSELDSGTALNIMGHMSIALGAWVSEEDLMGRQFLYDASKNKYWGISRYPVIVTEAKEAKIKQAILLAKTNPNLVVICYPKEMLDTGHDDELAENLLRKKEEEVEFLGVLIFGKTTDVSTVTKKFSLWKRK